MAGARRVQGARRKAQATARAPAATPRGCRTRGAPPNQPNSHRRSKEINKASGAHTQRNQPCRITKMAESSIPYRGNHLHLLTPPLTPLCLPFCPIFFSGSVLVPDTCIGKSIRDRSLPQPSGAAPYGSGASGRRTKAGPATTICGLIFGGVAGLCRHCACPTCCLCARPPATPAAPSPASTPSAADQTPEGGYGRVVATH